MLERIRSHKRTSFLIVLILLLGSFAFAQFGAGWDLSWWTVDGGGGTSSGGPFYLTGVIGQPEAAPSMSGGPFTLQGGFVQEFGPHRNAASDWTLYKQ